MPETTTREDVKKTRKMTEREIFVFAFTVILFNPVVTGLSRQRRDEILLKIKEKFCPSITNADWYVLFHGAEQCREPLTHYLNELLTNDEKMNVKSNYESLVGDTDKINNLVDKVKSDMGLK